MAGGAAVKDGRSRARGRGGVGDKVAVRLQEVCHAVGGKEGGTARCYAKAAGCVVARSGELLAWIEGDVGEGAWVGDGDGEGEGEREDD